MTPYQRLLAETIPTRPAPATPRPRPAERRPWTRAEQDAHWQQLCEAIGARDEQRPALRLVHPAA